jgi:hypothetical protein
MKMITVRSTAKLLLCTSLLATLAACATPDGGYYDKNGNWIATDTPHNRSEGNHAPLPGGVTHYYDDDYHYYSRRGYYDYSGEYVSDYRGTPVPSGMFPPRGMCRVWFSDRMVANQPPIESCVGIRDRAPEGSFVIYGG